MRTIEDDSFVDIFDFNLLATFNVDFMHPNGPRKMFNWLQSGGASYAPMKNMCDFRTYHIYWEDLIKLLM